MSSYFSFTREPFSRELAPHEVFVTRGHQELIARLRHAISTCAGTADRDIGSLAVITGQVGCGKSPTIRSFVHTLDASKYRYIYLASSVLSPAEFYPCLPCRHR
jgi:type II secretory pathway predicted ATPase ExeA